MQQFIKFLDLSNIEKMKYLLNLLGGEAKTASKGLILDNQNYVIANVLGIRKLRF